MQDGDTLDDVCKGLKVKKGWILNAALPEKKVSTIQIEFGGWIFPFLFWGLIIFAIISIIRRLIPGNRSIGKNSALDILKKRYASGEINKQEFSEMKSVL